ncbi:MAG: zf-HC2 domain-containing protein [Verrucomicrobiota bacterium]
MNCERVKELLPDALAETLDERTKGELEAHLSGCTSCRDEVTNLQSVWAKLATLPEPNPSPALDDRFRTTLEAFREGQKQALPNETQERPLLSGCLGSLWPKQPVFQFAMAVLLFAFGLFLGLETVRRPSWDPGAAATNQAAVAQLREEMAAMKQLLALSLLQQPSASERLRGVELTSRLDQPDVQVLSVLLRVLELDPNVNVRLAAVGALQQFINHLPVRKGLIDALAHAQSPLLQIDLIDALVRANAKDSVTVIESLLKNPEIEATVRERAEGAIRKLS